MSRIIWTKIKMI